jgi:hypothetical protein
MLPDGVQRGARDQYVDTTSISPYLARRRPGTTSADCARRKISHVTVPLGTGNDQPGIWAIGLDDCQGVLRSELGGQAESGPGIDQLHVTSW